jgi:hypothetical protein
MSMVRIPRESVLIRCAIDCFMCILRYNLHNLFHSRREFIATLLPYLCSHVDECTWTVMKLEIIPRQTQTSAQGFPPNSIFHSVAFRLECIGRLRRLHPKVSIGNINVSSGRFDAGLPWKCHPPPSKENSRVSSLTTTPDPGTSKYWTTKLLGL